MNCGEVRPLISAYHDGEATPEERRVVEHHLATCEACRTVLAEYRAIGGDLRVLSVPLPPAGLRRDVWRAIEANQGGSRIAGVPPARGKLLALPQTPRFGGWTGAINVFTHASNGWAKALPVALLAGAFVVIMSFLIIRNSPPVAAAHLEEQVAISNYGQAVHVVFSKSVIPSDAEAGTRIDELTGSSEQPVTFTPAYQSAGNTMELWPKDTWKPGANYKITIDARSIRQPLGNEPLGNAPIVLTFSAAAYTPTVTNTPTHTPVPTVTPVPPTATPKPTQEIINAENTPQPENSPSVPSIIVPAPTNTAQQNQSGATATTPGTATVVHNTPVPSATLALPTNTIVPSTVPAATVVPATPTSQPPPTNTIEATRTASATATITATARPTGTATMTRPAGTATATATRKTTPTATGTVQPKGTPTRGTTPSATATTGGCLLTPVRGFGKIWTERASVHERIGCPTMTEDKVIPAAEQHFQGGYMFWRGDTHMVYVFVGDNDKSGMWYEFKDTWVEGEPIPSVGGTPPPGAYIPIRGFGKVWANTEGIRQALGYAVDQETNIDAVWQPFEHGYALWTSDRTIRFLYDDGGWEHYNDTYQSDEETIPAAGS